MPSAAIQRRGIGEFDCGLTDVLPDTASNRQRRPTRLQPARSKVVTSKSDYDMFMTCAMTHVLTSY